MYKFNENFYPTPKEVVEIMLEGLQLEGKVVLEPSVGTGNIVEVLKAKGAKVLGCEIDPNLSQIAMRKVDTFLTNDFLDVMPEDVSHIDYVIMNPPFCSAVKHILHAYDIMPENCTLVSLANMGNFESSYGSDRKRLITLLDANGRNCLRDLGHCFENSERVTSVQVGMVTLFKAGDGCDEFDGYFFSGDEEEGDSEVFGLLPYNVVRDYVQRYITAVKSYEELQNMQDRINEATEPFGGSLKLSFKSYRGSSDLDGNYSSISFTDYKKALQKSAWKSLFNSLNLGGIVTSSTIDMLNKFIETQSEFKFTEKNIYEMLRVLHGTRGSRLDKCLLGAFEEITKYYPENRYNVEGWKTNSSYLVGKKFILPDMVESDLYYGKYVNFKYRRRELVMDIVRSLCYLTGTSFNECVDLETFKANLRNVYFGRWYDFNFFEIKCFKKGTIHFKFKDEKVWEMFNRKVAEIRGISLPEKI